MRIAFVKALTRYARTHPHVMLLTGDIGYSVFEEYKSKLPKQFINMGVAEQNMTGVAAGLSMEGKLPIIYSIIPFVTMRNFEQIRNDICYQDLNVKIVGVGAGFSYGPYGHTHHALEDIGIMRMLPNMVILCPGDPIEVKLCFARAMEHRGPVYIRLGKAGEPTVYTKTPDFRIGKGIIIRRGKDITILATSTLLGRACEVASDLEKSGIKTSVVSMPTIKPIDTDLVRSSALKFKAIFTLEEHSIIGGLGSAVAEVLAEYDRRTVFRRIAVPDRFTRVIGLQEFMREANGLTKSQIVTFINNTLKVLSKRSRLPH